MNPCMGCGQGVGAEGGRSRISVRFPEAEGPVPAGTVLVCRIGAIMDAYCAACLESLFRSIMKYILKELNSFKYGRVGG